MFYFKTKYHVWNSSSSLALTMNYLVSVFCQSLLSLDVLCLKDLAKISNTKAEIYIINSTVNFPWKHFCYKFLLIFAHLYILLGASLVVQRVESPPANAGAAGDAGSISGSGRPPGEGNDNPLQYFCLESSMDRGAWQATVHGVAVSWT